MDPRLAFRPWRFARFLQEAPRPGVHPAPSCTYLAGLLGLPFLRHHH
jgi:hypothetical protein